MVFAPATGEKSLKTEALRLYVFQFQPLFTSYSGLILLKIFLKFFSCKGRKGLNFFLLLSIYRGKFLEQGGVSWHTSP
jgi:hypothetical protein